jgi:hypothetical protein
MLKELVPGLHGLFGLSYARYTDEHKDIFEIQTSDRAYEEETLLSGFGAAPVKQEGSTVAYDEAAEVWTARYTHETIALAFSITEEAIEDNLYDKLSARYTKALARSMAYTKQVKAANVLNNAFNSSYAGGDGQQLCSTSHPLAGGGTLSNTLATHADLSETALEAMTISIAGFVDERGIPIALTPQKLIIPTALVFVARRILESPNRVGTADNDINVLNRQNTIPGGFSVNHFLTSTSAYWLKTDASDGLKMFQRVPLKTSSDGDFETGNLRFRARERYSFGWSDPRGIYGSS